MADATDPRIVPSAAMSAEADTAIAAVERISDATKALTAATIKAALAARELELARHAFRVALATANAGAAQSRHKSGWLSLLKPGGRYWRGTEVEAPQLETARLALLRHLHGGASQTLND